METERDQHRDGRGLVVEYVIIPHAPQVKEAQAKFKRGQSYYLAPNSRTNASSVRRQSSREPMTT